MQILILFGVGMCLLGGIMAINPIAFSKGVVAFSQKPWFHAFEITSRLMLGLLFILYAAKSTQPNLLYGLGSLLCFVSLFLVVIGAEKHRQFAMLTSKIGGKFRLIGLLSLCLGVVLINIGFN